MASLWIQPDNEEIQTESEGVMTSEEFLIFIIIITLIAFVLILGGEL